MLNNGPYLLGIDYGTESCRVAIFDLAGRPLTFAATPYKTTHPRPGWGVLCPPLVQPRHQPYRSARRCHLAR